MSDDEREFDPNNAAEYLEFDARLFEALVAAREWYRDSTFTPDHMELWRVVAEQVSENADLDELEVRLMILPGSSPVTVRVRVIHPDGTEESYPVNGLALMPKGSTTVGPYQS